jgi:hypothetical protein
MHYHILDHDVTDVAGEMDEESLLTVTESYRAGIEIMFVSVRVLVDVTRGGDSFGSGGSTSIMSFVIDKLAAVKARGA